MDVAKEVGADAVAHGCTGKGNDQACLTIISTLLCHADYINLTFFKSTFRFDLSSLSLR